jgi:tetratricopeptide (TPR) repeat protein
LGDGDRRTLLAMSELAAVYQTLGRRADVERIDLAVLDAQRRLVGPDAPETLTTLGNLAVFYYSCGRYEDARTLLEQELAGRRRTVGEDAEPTRATKSNLAAVEQKLGRLDVAERLLREVLKGRTISDGEDAPATLAAAVALGQCLIAMERWEEAEQLLRPTLATSRRVLGTKSGTRQVLYYLAQVLAARGQQVEARALASELMEAVPANDPNRSRYAELAEQLEVVSPEGASHEDL